MKQTDYKRRNNHAKLNMTMIALVVSIIVLVMATFAWFVLSTNPEIKGMNFHVKAEQAIQVSQDGENFSYSEDLSDKFNDVGALVPASTVDGLNWFVCKYDMSGNVLQGQDDTLGTQFQYMRFPNGGNVTNSTNSGTSEENTSVQDANASGSGETANTEKEKCYYIYTDIWLKTTEDETAVYLSVPSDANYGKTENSKADDTEQNHYGSYVMSYHVSETADENGNKAKAIQLTEGGSETCARVGFQVLGKAQRENKQYPEIKTDNVTTDKFYIYEPNADRRSEADKTSDEYNADKYVAGFEAKNFYGQNGNVSYTEADGYYIPTFPITLNSDTATKLKEELPKISSDNYDTTVRKWSIDGEGADADAEKAGSYKGYDGNISVFPADHLLAQRSSTWKQQNDANVQGQLSTDKFSFDSRMIGSMGKFLNTDLMYRDMGNLSASTNLTNINDGYKLLNVQKPTDSTQADTYASVQSTGPIVTLEKNTPVKVRLFFWIEGQDVDCWNDIADTDFLVNLEFVGVPVNK